MAESRYTVRVNHVLTSEESDSKSVVFSCSFVEDEDYLANPEMNTDERLTKYIVVDALRDKLQVFPRKGQRWKIKGKNHYAVMKKKSGMLVKEFHISPDRLSCQIPNSPVLFAELIGRDSKTFAGIGKGKAERLWNHFEKQNKSVLEAIKNRDIQELSSVKYITEEDVLRLIDGFEIYQNLDLIDMLNREGVPYSTARKIVKSKGSKAGEIYKVNPYLLMNYGMSFKDIDKIAMSRIKGKDKDGNDKPEFTLRDERRLNALVYTLLRRVESQGSTAATRLQLEIEARKLREAGSLDDASQDLIYEAVDCAIKSERVKQDEKGFIQSIGYALIENYVGTQITRLANSRFDLSKDVESEIDKASKKLPFKPTEEQVQAVKDAYHFGFSTLGGKAGTGKTAVIKLIIDSHIALGYDVQALALAGKATQEITKATDYPSSTISGFVNKYEPSDDKPLLVIIDEASMVGVSSINQVLKTAKVVKMILVGDGGQLPPVEAGLILHTIIRDERFHHSFLTKVQRQGEETGIPEFSSSVREGRMPEGANRNHIRFHRTNDKTEVIDKVAELYCKDIDNTQVICAVKDNEYWGVKQINERIQSITSPSDKRMVIIEGRQWNDQEIYVGDKVIFTKNDWEIPVTNGTLGVMTSVNHNPDEDDYGLIRLENNGEVKITFDLASMIEPAHAMTVHKAQGSHFPRVIIPVGEGFNYDRVWLYTALTRAVAQIEIVGNPKDLKNCIALEGKAEKRTTCLSNYLKHINH